MVDLRVEGLNSDWHIRLLVLSYWRMDENEAANKTVMINVSKQKFDSVYGEDGSNLTRLKEISGATVILQDPGHGESDGKVIISGTPEQIQMAESLLQAFVFL